MRTLLITGGAGFIGSNLVTHILETRDDVKIINLDALTYASDLSQELARRGSRRSVRVLRAVASVRFGEGRAGPHQASRRLRGRVVADVDGEDAVERGLHGPVVSGSGGV